MSKRTAKFKHWSNDERVSMKGHSSDNSNTATEQENQKHKGNDDDLCWNYVAFAPTNDPKHNNGAKPTILRSKTLQSKRQKAGYTKNNYGLDSLSKRRHSASNASDSEDETNRRKRTSNHSLPLLRNPFQLKYLLEGHSHLSLQSTNRKRKSTSSTQKKSKGKKKESSSTRHGGRGRSQQTDPGNDDVGEEDQDSDDEDDNSLDIWACEFEPSINTSSTVVALCGGSCILFLDTQQGRYVKKYAHPEPLECFYTLAWTLLRGSRQLGRDTGGDPDSDKSVSNDNEDDDDIAAAILAAAGKFGSIKLLEPTQTQCYRYLFGHQQPVLKLCFSKKEPRWLLSSSMDMTVRLWDIGTPSSEHDDSSCLAHFTVPGTGHPTSMSLSYDLSLLVVGTNNADLLQYAIGRSQIKKWREDTYKSKAHSNTDQDIKDTSKPPVIKPKSKFPHGEEWHEGYVEDVYILGQDGTKSNIGNFVVSRGSDDMEVVIWNPKTSTKTDADIHLSLEWPEADDCTGMRFTVVEKNEQKLLLGGDSNGEIRLYNIGDGNFSKTLKDGSKELFDPMKVFTHESSNHVIRDVCVSLDTRKFVAVDSNNTVFVWCCN